MLSDKNILSRSFLPTCADQTPMAIVKLLASSTTVLKPPSVKLSVLLPIANAWKYVWRLMVYASMIPPKNITSVTRKIHIPSDAVSFCCSSVLNCPYSAPVRCTRHSSIRQVQAFTCPPASGSAPRVSARVKPGTTLIVAVSRNHTTARGMSGRLIQTEVRPVVEVVRLPRHHGRHFKVFRRRRRWRLPLQPGCRPRIIASYLAVKRRPRQINHR